MVGIILKKGVATSYNFGTNVSDFGYKISASIENDDIPGQALPDVQDDGTQDNSVSFTYTNTVASTFATMISALKQLRQDQYDDENTWNLEITFDTGVSITLVVVIVNFDFKWVSPNVMTVTCDFKEVNYIYGV